MRRDVQWGVERIARQRGRATSAADRVLTVTAGCGPVKGVSDEDPS
jgi:hypothetical protein